MQKGRRYLYDTEVKPHLKEIEEMALTLSEVQIYGALGISAASWYRYKRKEPELVNALHRGRLELCRNLKGILIKKAEGFNYIERKEIKEDGKTVKEEIYTKTALPDTGAIHLLLKNYDSENWAENPPMVEIKKKELDLHQKRLELLNW